MSAAPGLSLHRLLHDVPVGPLPDADPLVSGVSHDSRRTEPGDLFVAIVGDRHDGRRYAAQAVENGAVAVLGPGPPEPVDAPWVETRTPRDLLGPLASRVYGHPDRGLAMVGVTGTNGKTTVAALVAACLEAAGRPTGIVGTLGYRFGGFTYAGDRTTPEASDLFRMLHRMRTDGAEAVVMEVSSHALELGRVRGATFDVAVFTNLSRDHLDFHPDLESYFEAKARLFDQVKPEGTAVVGVTDPLADDSRAAYAGDDAGRRLVRRLREAGMDRLITFGSTDGDVRIIEHELSADGIRAAVHTPRGRLEVRSRLLGHFNLLNVLAAVAVGEALDLDHRTVAAGLASVDPIPGRLEPVDGGQVFPALVDFAHTPDALEAALRSVREMDGVERVAVVFGCGGDRDRGKRPLMGRAAGELADLVVVTSDNPRSEDPLAIMAEIEEGVRDSGQTTYRMVPDRRQAIRGAVRAVGAGWVLLVAGKGHEGEQIVGDRRTPFSDREELLAALRAVRADGEDDDGRA